MLIILAWMSVRASVTLAALLTLILFPVAVLTLRRSVPFAVMTLAMLGMMWRGETWKYGCLIAEQQLQQRVSELELRPRQLPLSNSEFCYREPDFLRGASCSEQRPVSSQPLAVIGRDVPSSPCVLEDCDSVRASNGSHNSALLIPV